MMAHSPPALHGPDAKRPKGILKTSSSYHRSPPTQPVTVVDPQPPTTSDSIPPVRASSPEWPHDGGENGLTERDLVLQNTLRNAGRRRSSSNQSRGGAGSRRQSHHELDDNPEASPRLKWDEANLYLTEQERTPKMKIDEPKTPFAKGYDPTEDEAELRMLDAEELQVDELDMKPRRRVTPDRNIPDLDLGEPEAPKLTRKDSHSPKQVVVKEDDETHHTHEPGAEPETPEEEEKHKKFEELRKKHYEMKNVANLLGHLEYLEEEDDDGDVELQDADEDATQSNGAPEVPKIPGNFANGD